MGIPLNEIFSFSVLLPRLCRVVMGGKRNEEDGIIFALEVLDVYSVLTCCQLPDHVIAHFVLPPLHQVML